jgi:hypothetical protein
LLPFQKNIAPEGVVSEQKVEETRSALRELGLNDILDKDLSRLNKLILVRVKMLDLERNLLISQ